MMAVGCSLAAVLLIGLGVWSLRTVPERVPRSLGERERRQRMRMLRRGATACFLVAAILICFVVDAVVH
ncbi:hypothetical protein [Pseudonocardia spinosispora]|uniref:hypothetical protein n=1 Tax=Pseudonocardia spinosispora TaxID=103441 RepID=UPI0004285227|nr:hypothetical protein [Pseudonocardia spinosispora]